MKGNIMDVVKLEDYPFFMWEYEEQTKMKHKVLKDYLDKWSKILGKYSKLYYYDCFAGCGAYYDRDREEVQYGSPIIANECANENDREISIYLIDKENENLKK